MTSNLLQDLKLNNLTDLTGKVALVTGGGTGIGLMMAKGLAANGATVYITGRREEVLKEVHQQYKDIHPLKMDATKKDEIANAVKDIEKKEGKLNILINNAGDVGPFYPFSITPGSEKAPFMDPNLPKDVWSNSYLFNQHGFTEWSRIFDVNLSAAFFVTMAFLDLLKQGAGESGRTSSVIMVSSVYGEATNISWNLPAYSTSKTALSQLTLNLASEFARHQIPIRVNTMSPGPFPSGLTADAETLEQFLGAGMVLPGGYNPSPLRRPGTEKEIASLAVYLASPMSDYTNGNNIIIDGGLHLVNP